MPDTEDPSAVLAHVTQKQKVLNTIAGDNKTSFRHIFLYNSIQATGSAREGIDGFIHFHSNLIALHGFMAGFQYVAMVGLKPDFKVQTAFVTLQTLGFVMSMSGTIISLTALEFLATIKMEPLEFQVESVLFYGPFFRVSDMTAFMAVVLLVAASNLLLYNTLPAWICYFFHSVSALVTILVFLLWKHCIIDRQPFTGGRLLYSHKRAQHK